MFEIIQEDEETERVKYNALLDQEDEESKALNHQEKDPEKDGNDSAYASKVGNYTTVFELFTIWFHEFQMPNYRIFGPIRTSPTCLLVC